MTVWNLLYLLDGSESIEHEEYNFLIFRINFLIPMTPVSKTDKIGEEKKNLYFNSIVIFLKSEGRFRGRFLGNLPM